MPSEVRARESELTPNHEFKLKEKVLVINVQSFP
jgi:hypothetical protein